MNKEVLMDIAQILLDSGARLNDDGVFLFDDMDHTAKVDALGTFSTKENPNSVKQFLWEAMSEISNPLETIFPALCHSTPSNEANLFSDLQDSLLDHFNYLFGDEINEITTRWLLDMQASSLADDQIKRFKEAS